MGQVIAVDWDHTAYDNATDDLMPGVREAFDAFHDAGHKILIHSCNNPGWIRRRCSELGLRPDWIWGEERGFEGTKPVASAYIDDRAIQFVDWSPERVADILNFVGGRPVTKY